MVGKRAEGKGSQAMASRTLLYDVRRWLPELARALGAKPPRRVPVWLGRLFAGDVGVSMMTRIRGVANGKAKRELDWKPRYQSWRDGFRYCLGDSL